MHLVSNPGLPHTHTHTHTQKGKSKQLLFLCVRGGLGLRLAYAIIESVLHVVVVGVGSLHQSHGATGYCRQTHHVRKTHHVRIHRIFRNVANRNPSVCTYLQYASLLCVG